MKFIEIWRHSGSCIWINCKDVRAIRFSGNDVTFHMFSDEKIFVKAWTGWSSEFSNFLSNEDTQFIFKFVVEKEGGK